MLCNLGNLVGGLEIGVVTLTDANVTELGGAPAGNRVAGIEVRGLSGQVFSVDGDDGGSLNFTQLNSGSDWIIPNDTSQNKSYVVRFTVTGGSGSLDGGSSSATASWLALNDTRGWYITRSTTGGPDTVEGTIAISDDGGSTTLDSMNTILSVQVT